MKILGYMQLHNEERFALASLNAIIDIVDDMILVIDRCEDDTVRQLGGYTNQLETRIIAPGDELYEEKLIASWKSLFVDYLEYDWIFVVRGDEVYHPSILGLKNLLSKKPIGDVTHIIGHTLFVNSEDYCSYTAPASSMYGYTTTQLYNNSECAEVIEATPWGPTKIKYTGGSKVIFDLRNSVPVFGGLTSFHFHNLKRSSLESFERKPSLTETYYDADIIVNDISVNEHLKGSV